MLTRELARRVPGLGKVRARCKSGAGVVDFGRVPPSKERDAARAAERLGLKFVAGATDTKGPNTYANAMVLEDRRGSAK